MTKIKHDFLIFHYKNPKLWQWIDYFALERATTGWEHYSIQGVIERARWHTSDPTQGDTFKIRNEFAAHYSRLWMLLHPEYPKFFRTNRIPDDDLPDRDDYSQEAAAAFAAQPNSCEETEEEEEEIQTYE